MHFQLSLVVHCLFCLNVSMKSVANLAQVPIMCVGFKKKKQKTFFSSDLKNSCDKTPYK